MNVVAPFYETGDTRIVLDNTARPSNVCIVIVTNESHVQNNQHQRCHSNPPPQLMIVKTVVIKKARKVSKGSK